MAGTPKRVVSMNVCTDQLAMLLAGEDQLHSVSFLASDPRSSAMTSEAEAFVANHGRAEEVYLMRPDLVLAGAYTSTATVEMLRRFDIPVEVFEPAQGMEDIAERMLQMGRALGREAEAARAVDDFKTRLAELQAETTERPDAALYYANGYTSGDKSLAGQILLAAGFDNIAIEAGYESGGVLPLEVLALSGPDAVITGQIYPGTSRSEAILDHPIVTDLRQEAAAGSVTNRDWVCGTPYVLRAVEVLSGLRQNLTGAED